MSKAGSGAHARSSSPRPRPVSESGGNDRRRLALGLGLGALGVALVIVASIVWSTGQGDRRELTWPSVGVVAVARGDDVTSSPGADQPRPIASLAKLITALVVLDRVPLDAGAAGPSFVLTADDVAYVSEEEALGGQTLPVHEGEVVTMRELLENMIVASSNNDARSLATHVFGSESAYLAAAAHWLQAHGLAGVTVADATGMAAGTRASAVDMVAIARLADGNALIAQVAGMPDIRRDDRLISSRNDLLGTFGIDGLKTGHTDAAGYNIVFTTMIDGTRTIGVVLGSTSEAQRATDVTRLIAQLRTH